MMGGLRAWAQGVPEYTMKATYLYNFMVFAQWPAPEPGEPLNLCVLGSDPFGAALDGLQGKPVNGRRLQVQRLRGYAGLRRCHLLFIAESEIPNLALIHSALGEAPVLTVADIPAPGLGIVLAVEGKRLVFDVSLSRVKRTGVELSSKVLQLARSTQ
jgi:hypothetical protein